MLHTSTSLKGFAKLVDPEGLQIQELDSRNELVVRGPPSAAKPSKASETDPAGFQAPTAPSQPTRLSQGARMLQALLISLFSAMADAFAAVLAVIPARSLSPDRRSSAERDSVFRHGGVWARRSRYVVTTRFGDNELCLFMFGGCCFEVSGMSVSGGLSALVFSAAGAVVPWPFGWLLGGWPCTMRGWRKKIGSTAIA